MPQHRPRSAERNRSARIRHSLCLDCAGVACHSRRNRHSRRTSRNRSSRCCNDCDRRNCRIHSCKGSAFCIFCNRRRSRNRSRRHGSSRRSSDYRNCSSCLKSSFRSCRSRAPTDRDLYNTDIDYSSRCGTGYPARRRACSCGRSSHCRKNSLPRKISPFLGVHSILCLPQDRGSGHKKENALRVLFSFNQPRVTRVAA